MIDHRQAWRFVILLACAASGAAGLAQTNAPTAPALDAATYERVVSENVDLRREQARLTKEATDLRRRNASLVVQIQDLDRKQEALATAMAGLQAPDELKAEVERLRKDRDTLSREVERIRAEAQAVREAGGSATGAVATASPSPGSDLYRKLERENTELRQQLAHARESTQNEAQAREASGQRGARLEAQVDELERDLAAARREVEQAARREKLLASALVKVARKAQAYEAELKAAANRAAPPASTGTVVVVARPRADLQPSILDAGRKAIAAGRFSDAERLYLAGLQRQPGDAALAYNLGVLYDDYLQEPRKAAIYYRKYLELAPHAPDASLVRSWLVELDVKSAW